MIFIAAGAALFLGAILLSNRFGSGQWLPVAGLAGAFLAIPLSVLGKRTGWIFLGLGVFFLIQGMHFVYVAFPELAAGADTAYDILAGFCGLGLPAALLSLSIFFLWSRGRSGSPLVQIGQFALFVLLEGASFVLAMLPVWSEVARFGSAALAVVFGLVNLIIALRP